MAQKTLETKMLELFKNAIKGTGIKDIYWSGGVASNIKANMLIRHIAKDWFVFPAMGDGGLALGAAFLANKEFNDVRSYVFDDVYLGDGFSDVETEKILKENKLNYTKEKDIAKKAAQLILSGKIVLWFQGRTEFGPRALGNRSILAPAGLQGIKDTLNIMVKNRDWFQPFCPTILEEDAKKVFLDYDGRPDRLMTMGYKVRPEMLSLMTNVVNVDSTARPQMLGKENKLFRKLLLEIKKKNKIGVTLNTSFNIHGFPICNTPEDAVVALKTTRCQYLAIGTFLVRQNED
jgi:carbamoyltransferase